MPPKQQRLLIIEGDPSLQESVRREYAQEHLEISDGRNESDSDKRPII